MKIAIPKIERWDQTGGDMDPATYGGIITRADGDAIEMREIQPVREAVGDEEAVEIGFPWWSKEGYYELADLSLDRPEVQSVLRGLGTDLANLEANFTPTERALVIAEALLRYGVSEEGPAGWADDVVPGEVKWADGTVAGPEYFSDEEDEFRREVMLADLDLDYESFGPEADQPTSGLRVKTNYRGDVEITEWTDIEAATGEEQPGGAVVVRQDAVVELDELLDPNAKHRESYSGDNKDVTLVELSEMSPEQRQEAIVAAAIAYLAYWGGEEEYVDAVGD